MNLDRAVDLVSNYLSAGVRAKFAADPLGVLQTDLGFTVRAVEHLSTQRDDGGFCDGVSFLEDSVILYAPTPNSRRENFTLAHELGHWAVDQVDSVLNWLANQRNPHVVLESICDRLAQRLLLPIDTIDSVVAGEVLRAEHVQLLYDASNASYPACAIALASRLNGLGAVVLIDRYNSSVSHASVRPDPVEGWPLVFPWRDQPVSESHPLMMMEPGTSATKRVVWRTPWNASHDFYANAVADQRRIIAVLSDVDLWTGDRRRVEEVRDFDKRPLGRIFCCGEERLVRGYPCPKCKQQFCPTCGFCQCDRAGKREDSCVECFMKFQPQLLENGLCESCR